MYRENICDLGDSLSRPLNLRLHLNQYGEERIPFHLSVQSDEKVALEPECSFMKFSGLPHELQLRILQMCDSPTLFQLMHVSSAIRTESSKLFWSDPERYYLVNDAWLIKYRGYPGHTANDLSFCSQAQNLEVWHSAANPISNLEDLPRKADGSFDYSEWMSTISDYWKTLKLRFPNAKKVVFNQPCIADNMSPRELTYRDSSQEPWHLLQFLNFTLQQCPPGIQASAYAWTFDPECGSYHRGNMNPSVFKVQWQRCKFTLHNSSADGKPNWDIHPGPWHRKTITIPAKRFRGPVGHYRRLLQEHWIERLHRFGIKAQMMAILDRVHFSSSPPSSSFFHFTDYRGYSSDRDDADNTLPCTDPFCNRLLYAGCWVDHLVNYYCKSLIPHYDTSIQLARHLPFLPEEVRGGFEEVDREYVKWSKEWIDEWTETTSYWYSKEDGVKQGVEGEFKRQLVEDEEWWTPEEEAWVADTRYPSAQDADFD